MSHRNGPTQLTAALIALILAFVPASAYAGYQSGLPPGIDPGTPTFAGPQDPVPLEPVPFDPSASMLSRIFDGDVTAGGTSYWIDRVLERPFLSNQDTYLYTRGRALYMYTHNAGALGFGGGYAYRERPRPAPRPTPTPCLATQPITNSGLPIQQGTYVARNTIWGTQGSPNAQDWLEVDLGAPSTFDTVRLYFFSDKTYMTQSNGSGNTYRPPSSYTVQIFDGTGWVDVAGQVSPMPNLNTLTFPTVSAQRVRLLVTNRAGFGTGVKEFQIFKAASCDTTIEGTRVGRLAVTSGITCLADGARIVGPVSVEAGAGLIATGATIAGPVTAQGARTVQLLGGQVTGPVTIEGTTGRVALSGARFSVHGIPRSADRRLGRCV